MVSINISKAQKEILSKFEKKVNVNTKVNESEQIITNEVSSNSSKSLLFTEIDSINNESSIKKSLKNE